MVWGPRHAPCFSGISCPVQVVLCQINIFCHQLTQNARTDFFRFTKIYTNSNNEFLQILNFITICINQPSYFGLIGVKICWSEKEWPVIVVWIISQNSTIMKVSREYERVLQNPIHHQFGFMFFSLQDHKKLYKSFEL